MLGRVNSWRSLQYLRRCQCSQLRTTPGGGSVWTDMRTENWKTSHLSLGGHSTLKSSIWVISRTPVEVSIVSEFLNFFDAFPHVLEIMAPDHLNS
jgi:hypothetical protein